MKKGLNVRGLRQEKLSIDDVDAKSNLQAFFYSQLNALKIFFLLNKLGQQSQSFHA